MYVIWAIHFAHMGTIARGWFAADDDTKRIGKILPEAFLLGKKQSTAYIHTEKRYNNTEGHSCCVVWRYRYEERTVVTRHTHGSTAVTYPCVFVFSCMYVWISPFAFWVFGRKQHMLSS